MNITVYLGASFGHDPIYREEIIKLGQWIAKNNHTLIYGGSKVGLMGLLATTVLDNGSHVIGVEPQFFVDDFLQVDNLDELIITQTMAERKTKMMELGDLFIAFPGGTGTLEEISEVISAGSLNKTDKPYYIYNLNGFYDPLKQLFEHMVSEGFVTQENYEKIHFISSISQLDEQLITTRG